jgi:hypothetical protein
MSFERQPFILRLSGFTTLIIALLAVWLSLSLIL